MPQNECIEMCSAYLLARCLNEQQPMLAKNKYLYHLGMGTQVFIQQIELLHFLFVKKKYATLKLHTIEELV